MTQDFAMRARPLPLCPISELLEPDSRISRIMESETEQKAQILHSCVGFVSKAGVSDGRRLRTPG